MSHMTFTALVLFIVHANYYWLLTVLRSPVAVKKKKRELDDVEVHKVINKPINVSPHLVHGC